MTYAQTLDYLFTRLPMYSRIGAAALKPDLTNTLALCEALGNPHQKFPSIHIAGTNGKGSTSHMLAAVLQSAGYKTGLYTSPHLKDFRERIRVNGEMIDESFVTGFVSRTIGQAERLDPSFFEITVAMAFDYFADKQVDIAVIEVGLGGRLDSTNIITPVLSVITNIGWDHMNILGNTLPLIAYEKAGIIKPFVPVVVGAVLPETRPVFEKKAAMENAALTVATDNWYCSGWEAKTHSLDVTVVEKKTDLHAVYALDLQGLYQTGNILTVAAAIHELREKGWVITEADTRNGLSNTRKLTGLHGRWEIIHRQPVVVLDVAHNEDGMRQVALQLETTSFHHLHIVIGLVKDKEVKHILSMLPVTATCYFTRAQIPRALPEEKLAAEGHAAGLTGEAFPSVTAALAAALANAHADDVILVCGSVFVVGEVDRLRN